MPTLAALAARGEVGRAAVIPPGMPPGSDVGNMSILGYDPAEFHTGRAPIEAAALGLRLPPDRVAYRCNLSTIGDDGTMVDFAGGHPSTEQATAVIEALDAAARSWRRWRDRAAPRRAVPPHPRGAGRLGRCRLHAAPRPLRPAGGVAHRSGRREAPSGDGRQPRHRPRLRPGREPGVALGPGLPAADAELQRRGPAARPASSPPSTSSAASASSPTSIASRSRAPPVGSTPNYEGKRDAALRSLAEGADLFLIHVEATDEAGHAGNLEEKVKALEAWDRRILADLVDGLDALGPWRMLLLPDHPTPVELKTHTTDSVPYLLVDSTEDGPGGTYTEAATAGCADVPGHDLMARLVRQDRLSIRSMFSASNASAEAVSGPAKIETMNSSVSGFAKVSALKASRRTRPSGVKVQRSSVMTCPPSRSRRDRSRRSRQ